MANEITATTNISVDSGNYAVSYTQTKQFNQSQAGFFSFTDQVATGAGTNLAIDTDLVPAGEEGWLLMKNLDSTNYVEWGIASNHIGRMLPGETAEFRIKPSTTLNLVANTAACDVYFLVVRN